MSNPFKDAEKKKKVPPGGEQGQQTKVETEVVEPPKADPPKQEKPVVVENPLAGMIEPKPEGKAYSFYLSLDANEKLEKLAKQNKCSKSKALDALLRSLT